MFEALISFLSSIIVVIKNVQNMGLLFTRVQKFLYRFVQISH